MAGMHLTSGALRYPGGLQAVIMALDIFAFPEAEAETFRQLEKTRMKPTNREGAEQKELERPLPNALNGTLEGSLLPRGAGLDKIERHQGLIQTS